MTALASVRHRWARTRLAAKLALLSAALTAGVVTLSFAGLNARVRASTGALYADEVSRELRTLLRLRQEGDQQLVAAASLVAESPNLRSAVATYRVENQSEGTSRADLAQTVRRELERLAPDVGRDLLAVTDDHGRLFAAYVDRAPSPGDGMDVSGLPAVRAALDASLDGAHDSLYLSVLRVGPDHYHVGVAPLVLDGFTIGTVLLGERLDAAHATHLARTLGGDVVFASAGRPIVSTLPARLAGAAAASAAAPAGTVGPPRPLAADGLEFVTASLAVGTTQDGAPVRLGLLQPVSPAVGHMTHEVLLDFLAWGLSAVLLAAVGAAILARSVLHPLHAFARYLRAGAGEGGSAPPFDAERVSLEIRSLDASFRRLMLSLGHERSQLERRGADLAAANQVLTAEIGERSRVERELRESRAQLQQSQKLEAVGTLAGGVAHDFNNLLTVISGYTQLALMSSGRGSAASEDLKQVVVACDNAAALTQQLLAFSRKQVLRPRLLDMADAVADVEPMLRRLIPAHVTVRVEGARGEALVKADPGQLSQVLLNLAVNARDAMPDGGTLTVTTGTEPGDAGAPVATLSVRDTGTGMSPEVRERIFEPFFTTKDAGKGTGLGLATVYGIVAQSGGTIAVESEPGRGTLFTVRLPLVAESAATAPLAASDDDGPAMPRGAETVLVVDDADQVRALVARTLAGCGYVVLAARDAVEALDVLHRHAGPVDALITDVVMPGVSGPQLAERVAAERPEISVIYMSGYADDAVPRFELIEGAVLLRKPFTPLALARQVREAMDARHADLVVAAR